MSYTRISTKRDLIWTYLGINCPTDDSKKCKTALAIQQAISAICHCEESASELSGILAFRYSHETVPSNKFKNIVAWETALSSRVDDIIKWCNSTISLAKKYNFTSLQSRIDTHYKNCEMTYHYINEIITYYNSNFPEPHLQFVKELPNIKSGFATIYP